MAKASVEARLSQHDKEIAAIRKLLLQGGKMLVRLEAAQLRMEAAQLRTEKKLQGLIDALKPRNGHRNGGKV